MTDFAPPPLRDLRATLAALPQTELPWIAKRHVEYLDDRIHKIGILTEYLAGCGQVEKERTEFVEFVDRYTRSTNSDLSDYMAEYVKRFGAVRSKVEEQCDKILRDDIGAEHAERVAFWQDFAHINEVDSLHGMFLTSGRWYVNVMLPVFKELAVCTLPATIPESERATIAYDLARRVITPRFATPSPSYNAALERRFATMLVPLLQYYDRKLLFLFGALATTPEAAQASLNDFVRCVNESPEQFQPLLEMGVYPPFAWHELHSSRRVRRPGLTYSAATTPLLKAVLPGYETRTECALTYLGIFKEYELNYNNYNYKGRFGLVSKHFYLQTSERLAAANRDRFLDAILGDRFFDALAIIQSAREA